MNMNASSLFAGVILGALGTGYFVYGKKQGRYLAMASGAALCIVPYFIGNLLALLACCGVLLVLPFVIKG